MDSLPAFDPESSWFASDQQRIQAVEDLKALGAVERRLLSEAIEHQELTRSKRSVAVNRLEALGFVHVHDKSSSFGSEFHIKPAAWGEEAMELLESMQVAAQSASNRKARP